MTLRRVLIPLAVLMMASCTASGKKFDPADRRLARQDEYALENQKCTLLDGQLVATGDLINYSGRAVGFAVTFRFPDGGVDLGRRQQRTTSMITTR